MMVFFYGLIICSMILMSILGNDKLAEFTKSENIITMFSLSLVVTLMFQLLGFGFSRNYMTRYYKTDLFTKRISFLSTMPISINQIILSRYLYHTIMLLYMNFVIFSVLGIWGELFTSQGYTTVELIQIFLTWFGYSNLFGSLYICLELGYRGKPYFIISFIVVICMVIACIISMIIFQESVWQIVNDLIQAYGFIIPCVSLAAGGIVTFVMIKLLQRRLKTRDLYV
jgi:ABC-2 family transporter protein